MMNKRFKLIGNFIATAIVLLAPMAHADDSPHQFSANVAISTDYRFRGVSQTARDPAISGGFDYSYTPMGFYAGTWASNLDFAVPDPDVAAMELDLYAGFSGTFPNTGVGWDVGGLYYAYPGSNTGTGVADYAYWEAYGSLSYDFSMFSVTGGLNYSPDYFFESGDAQYLYGDVSVPLPVGELTLAGHVGHQWVDNNSQLGLPDYTDWKIGVSRDVGPFNFDVSYIDTDVGKSQCFGGSDFCQATAVFTISSSF